MKIHSSSDPSPVPKAQILEGVQTLRKVLAASNKDVENTHYFVTVTCHKISVCKKRTILIKLPHALYNKQSEICIFTKDTEKDDIDATEYYWDDYFKENASFSPKTVSVNSLNKNYKSYESRIKLASSYDLFLADERIVRFLPARLGKHFYQKRKFPLELKVTGENFSKRLDDILSATKWLVSGSGDFSSVMAANSSHTDEEIADNVEAIVKIIEKTVDRGWANVRSISVKNDKSMGIPIYENQEVDEKLSEKCENELKYLNRLKELEERRAELGLKRKRKRNKPRSKKAKKEHSDDDDENEKDAQQEKDEVDEDELIADDDGKDEIVDDELSEDDDDDAKDEE